MKVLVLAPEAYGGFGGIATYNIDLMDALCRIDIIDRIKLLPRLRGEVPGRLEPKVQLEAKASRGLIAFLVEVLRYTLRGDCELILCTHIHLLPFAWLAKGLRNTGVICVLYGVEAWVPPHRPITTFLAKRCFGYISISNVTADRFRAWSGVPKERIAVLPNAVHAENYGLGPKPMYLVERYGLADRRVIMTLGRLDPYERQKGIDELIDLMPRLIAVHSDLVYLIVGDGGDRPRLEERVAKAGLSSVVRFGGRVSDEEKADHYRLCDVFSMAGRQEGFGFVFLEALATGAPVVASALDGSRDAVIDGELGELANPDEPDSLFKAVLRALERPRIIPERLKYFSFDSFVARAEMIFERARGGLPVAGQEPKSGVRA